MKKGKRCLRALPAGYHEVKLYDPKSRSFRLLTGQKLRFGFGGASA